MMSAFLRGTVRPTVCLQSMHVFAAFAFLTAVIYFF